ncbi:mitochondrial enolase superfamily member 1-like isoform X1 [Leguminivora glycinivorella]|uniref:mitochondrial enolase superfamily member 1-like isoform X1 n=3 Tax=Leguminivora glycinivorella TaxID=1035111 RepID=UPI00200F8EB0|nr:mitochondrial enolase superfamily member 1-like isoform X1 [Leguminivora glycinivorella]
MTLNKKGLKIVSVDVKDVRFPTSLGGHGSDALHTDPNYSCAYVTMTTENGSQGFGLTFTCGRGTEIIVLTIRSMKRFLLGKNAVDIFADFAGFWRTLTNDSQMRWIGPEKGVAHLAAAAILNSLWDLWARLEKKPLWRLLTDMEPEDLVSTIDFRYITDVITKEEAIQLLKSRKAGQKERIKQLEENGYPAYTTQAGWLGYSDATLEQLCNKYLKQGFTHFKVKVGLNFEDDWRRCSTVRKHIGKDKVLMVDANQAWSVNEAIEWMKKLAPLKPMWIEEPTSPDDVLGHATISEALKPYGIGVATGEMCANRVMFKQFLQSGGMQFCQIDSARIGGVNEILSVYLMAEKLGVKVCPHAGGVGLCEMVQHLQYWDFASLSTTMEGRLIEYVDQQHEHFVDPCIVEDGKYLAPKLPGYSTQFKNGTLEKFAYPNGSEWKKMIKEGVFPPPDEAELVNP